MPYESDDEDDTSTNSLIVHRLLWRSKSKPLIDYYYF